MVYWFNAIVTRRDLNDEVSRIVKLRTDEVELGQVGEQDGRRSLKDASPVTGKDVDVVEVLQHTR